MADPFDRYGLDLDAARTLTGDTALEDADLAAAVDDLVDLLTYRPVDRTDRSEALLAFGRAVAWQATHRGGLEASGADAGTELSRESWPDYTADYAPGKGPKVTPVSPRAFALLVRFGWYATSGYTHAGRATAPDVWTTV